MTGSINDFIADVNFLCTIRTKLATEGTSSVVYMGFASPGSAETAPAWLIKKIITTVDGDMSMLFSNGKAEFSEVWSDYLTLSYF